MKKLSIAFCTISLMLSQITLAAQNTGYAAGGDNSTIKLISKDKKEFNVPRSLTDVLGLVKTSIEADKDAQEVPIPGVNGAELEIILQALLAKDRVKNFNEIQEALGKPITAENINEVYNAADYLGIDRNSDFFKALNKRYVLLLHDFLMMNEAERKKAKVDILSRAKVKLDHAKYYLPEVAKQYYLKYGEDIDDKLGVKSNKLTVQELVDAWRLSKDIVKIFPNLEKNPDELKPYIENEPVETRGGFRAMNIAIRDNDPKSILALLKLGANPFLNNKYMNRAAGMTGNNAITAIKLFVSRDVPFNEIIEQETPLMIAARNENKALVEYLLSIGADPNKKNELGEGPIQKAEETIKGIKQGWTGYIRPGASEKEKQQAIKNVNEIIDILKKHGAK